MMWFQMGVAVGLLLVGVYGIVTAHQITRHIERPEKCPCREHRGRPDVPTSRLGGTQALSERRGVVWDDPSGPPQYISLDDVDDLPEWGDDG
jgi:hypothetical protein